MKLNFPVSFDIQYPEENLLYYTGSGKSKLLKLLLDSCDGYCMYCGKNIKVDDKEEFNLEHSLEKSMKIEENNFLENCKYNLSIACPSCNQKYKTRMIDVVSEELISQKVQCSDKKCAQVCDEYIKILNEYIKMNNIILQPNCIDNTLMKYTIEYNLIKHIFEPGYGCKDEESRTFVSNHIARFHLNKEMYTKAILKVCEEICKKISILGQDIDLQNIFNLIKKERYDNVMEKVFIEFLESNFKSTYDLHEYCKFSLVLSYV